MPAPAPKFLEDDLQFLFSLLEKNEKLGALDRHNIEKKLETANLPDAFTVKAVIAAIYGKEELMRRHFKNVFYYAPEDPGYKYNYGLTLFALKKIEEAISAFKSALAHNLSVPRLLNSLALIAIETGDPEFQLAALHQANKLIAVGFSVKEGSGSRVTFSFVKLRRPAGLSTR